MDRTTTGRVRGLRTARLVLAPVLLGLLGGWAGIQLAPRASRDIGPVRATMALEPSVPVPGGGTVVDIPPLGSLRFSTHQGTLRLVVGVRRLNEADVRAIPNTHL